MSALPPLGPPEDELINGFTLEQLSDYLDAGRRPANPAIDDDPDCRNALAALERLQALSDDLVGEESRSTPPPEESWFQSILHDIAREARAGRSIPVAHPDPRMELSVTEGAIKALIRAAGDGVRGAVVGRTMLVGDVTRVGERIRVRVSIAADARSPLDRLAVEVRAAVAAALSSHAELEVEAIDIEITDVYREPPDGGEPA